MTKFTGKMDGHTVFIEIDDYDVDKYHFMKASVTHELNAYYPEEEWQSLTDTEKQFRIIQDLNSAGVTDIK